MPYPMAFPRPMTIERFEDLLALLRDSGPPLMRAALKGDTETVRAILDNGTPADDTDERWPDTPPLVWAAAGGHLATVRVLLERGAESNPPVRGELGTPLFVAAVLRRHTVVEALLEDGADACCEGNHYGESRFAPLFAAAWNGDLALLEILLGNTSELAKHLYSTIDPQPLHIAAMLGHTDMVRRLVAGGARLDVTATGMLPLHCAARDGHVGCLHALLNAGANPDPQLELSPTPVTHAIREGHLNAAALLMERGADGGRGLWEVARLGNAVHTRLLLAYGASPLLDPEFPYAEEVPDLLREISVSDPFAPIPSLRFLAAAAVQQ